MPAEKNSELGIHEELSKSDTVAMPFYKTFVYQIGIMVWRNYLLSRHYWVNLKLILKVGTLARTVGAPFLLMMLLFGLQLADWARQSKVISNPPAVELGGINRCIPGALPCINLLYFPDSEQVRSFLTVFAENNAIRTKQPKFIFDGAITSTSSPPAQNLDMVLHI
jgi:hypothetical protein